jgi:hypothetical protein
MYNTIKVIRVIPQEETMGLFNFFSLNSSQQSMQQDINQSMLSALQNQLQNTT